MDRAEESDAAWAAETLARYAASLHFEDIPERVVGMAKACLIDAVACAVFGSAQPWSRMALDYARSMASNGACRLPGAAEVTLPPGPAALALGVFAHAYELDSLRKPGAGVHPGATVALPALAMGQSQRADGKTVLAAIVAGCEAMFRIGAATLHTPEKVGFHAPGLTGPFGSAIACGRILGLSGSELANALGIAGSLASGLLAFAKAGEGGMVKRLHLGRAAESGVLAASLAASGYEGPKSVIDGSFGLLDVFCDGSNPALLTAGLGSSFETERICFKSYPCHITAHAPVQLLRQWMESHGFPGQEIRQIIIRASEKVVSHHNLARPRDMMLAQYSVPFCVALAAFRDPADPSSFTPDALSDSEILDLAGRTRLAVRKRDGSSVKGWGVDMEVELVGGRRLAGTLDEFEGTPERPFSDSRMEGKFLRLTGPLGENNARAMLDFLKNIEQADDVSKLPC